MTTTVEVKIRYRIAVSTSVKGVKTYDTTIDAEGLTQEEVLKRSDALVKELDARYPPGGTA
jgi:hypothetical protein